MTCKKTKLFTFDSHYTAFSLGKCGGNDCRKPDPVGVPGGLLNFCFLEKRPKLEILAFRRVSRHPQPRAQLFKVTTRMRQTFGLPPDLVLYLENCALGRGCRLIDEKVGNVCNLKKKDWIGLNFERYRSSNQKNFVRITNKQKNWCVFSNENSLSKQNAEKYRE